ncbi:heavy-metal-associated domain-containing protein [Sulfitobacter sp. MF3-043]|uniref:heavy-metal-associated domain-containing protein n=1 Tax=Sulfitobacter sediminivivens TaxID=3252902 RepID=UPI0036DF0E58
MPEMSCGHCKSAIENAIKEVDRNAQVIFEMANRVVTVNSDAMAGTLVPSMNAGDYESDAL